MFIKEVKNTGLDLGKNIGKKYQYFTSRSYDTPPGEGEKDLLGN
jgi:hypothetical protein